MSFGASARLVRLLERSDAPLSLCRFQVPGTQVTISAPRHQLMAVVGKREPAASANVAMTEHVQDLLAGLGVPEADGIVVSGARQSAYRPVRMLGR